MSLLTWFVGSHFDLKVNAGENVEFSCKVGESYVVCTAYKIWDIIMRQQFGNRLIFLLCAKFKSMKNNHLKSILEK